MSEYYFENERVVMHYYKFGIGAKHMLCFHGYGMHGKQFKVLEEALGHQYTFYGFDLFFHKKTKLKDQSLDTVKKGISKRELSALFLAFCKKTDIQDFSIIAHSMGSHYATTLVEEIPERVNELFIAAPSSFKPGKIITFLSSNKIGNKLLERLALSNNGMTDLLSILKRIRAIDQEAYDILLREVATPELRFSFYACASYMRFLNLNVPKFIENLNQHQIKSIFVFGKRDKSYPSKIGNSIIPKIALGKQVIINEDHNMINLNLGHTLSEMLNDY
jgi:pimeloyl-ACP methyl ester carboxylesterase